MRKGNVAKVGDFDTSKILTEEMTEAGLHPRGTRGFAALEVLNQLVYLIEQLKNQIMLPSPLEQPVVCQHLMLLCINNNVTLYECFTLWLNLPFTPLQIISLFFRKWKSDYNF